MHVDNGRKLTKEMLRVLGTLSTAEWRKAPLGTKSATILALEKRGRIDMRPRWSGMSFTYTDYELRLR